MCSRLASSLRWKSKIRAALELDAHGGRDLRRLSGIPFREWPSLSDDFHLRVGFDQLCDIGQRPFAVAAVVIKKLDNRDIAGRIADDLILRIKQLLVVLRQSFFVRGGLGDFLSLRQLLDGQLDTSGLAMR